MQAQRLQTYLAQNRHTAFGVAHQFRAIRSYAEFVQRVPLQDYESLQPWVERICRGEQRVLTRAPVTRLVPTSGSTGGRKLIPFTTGLQQEFQAAIAPWLVDLMRQFPGLACGPAYWSVTPVGPREETAGSVVPIGFDSDTAYLGGARQRLARAVLAGPEQLRDLADLEVFRYVTLLCLLRQRDLRLISVWHPSFLTLLLDLLPDHGPALEADVRNGTCQFAARLAPALRAALDLTPRPRRADELRTVDWRRPETIWPKLQLLSCWGDGAAAVAANALKPLFPKTALQPKGLLATEACVTIPFMGQQPVAVRSHFFEFADAVGRIRRVHELELGQTYEVIVTTGGGLWRYRLHDCVEVTGFVHRTPSLRFLARSGNVSDLFGEKLTEAFVAQTLQDLLAPLPVRPRFVLLAPDWKGPTCRYTLYVEGDLSPTFAAQLDQALRRNPHYAYCRDLGQLLPVRRFKIAAHGYEAFARRELAPGGSLGQLKPLALSRTSGWSTCFTGDYDPPN